MSQRTGEEYKDESFMEKCHQTPVIMKSQMRLLYFVAVGLPIVLGVPLEPGEPGQPWTAEEIDIVRDKVSY